MNTTPYIFPNDESIPGEPPTATAMTASSRRTDRVLVAVAGLAAATLAVGALALIGTGGGSDAPAANAAAPTPVATPLAPAPDSSEPDAAVASEPPQQPETTQEPAPAPPAEPAPETEPEPVPTPEPTPEPEVPVEPADPGDPDPNEPHVNPCVEAAEANQQFFAVDEIVLDKGQLGGVIRIGSCTPQSLAIEATTVPGVLLSFDQFDLQPEGTDLAFIIDPAAFDDDDIEFKIKITEVGCCAHYIDVATTTALGPGPIVEIHPAMLDD